MKWPVRFASLFIALSLLIAALWVGLHWQARYPTGGELTLPGLEGPVTVHRDDQGMAYAHAETFDDAIYAQGFVTAQDRLLQMCLARLAAQGRLTELGGDRALGIDTLRRTLGFHRLARRHAEILGDDERAFFQRYADGVNAYLQTQADDLPFEFTLAKLDPEPWTVEDSLSILYYMGWGSAADLKHQVMAQDLVEALGPQRAAELFPININPDDPAPPAADPSPQTPADGVDGGSSTFADASMPSPISRPAAPAEGLLPDALLEPYAAQLGSNNWAVGGHRSAGGKPILAGDPHLDPRMLPGIWHPVGLVWGDGDGTLRAVGAGVPGIPGLTVMRSSHVAMSVTNAYGDVQDLYIETVDPGDPGRYLEGDRSVPFEVRQEVLRIRDDDAEGGYREHPIEIRSTRRGPVVTGVLPKLRSTETLTLRWAPAETMGPDIGFAHALLARSVDDIDGALRHLTMVGLNFVFADVHGDIAWRVSGRQPIRAPGAGVVPRRVEDLTELEDGDDWLGWIPFEEMPHARNPGRGWVGTANHLTIPADYPHYYTSLAASSYRYRRLVQLLAGDDPLTVDDHWRMQRDTYNTMAAAVAPIMATALEADSTGPNGWIAQVARLLSDWDFHDDPERPEPLLFQEIYRHFASAVFEDELGPELAADLLDNLYFWQERLQAMVTAGDSPWFDDRTTEAVETRDDLFRHAAREAFGRLAPDLGADPGDWRWGDLHRLSLHHPLRPSGFGAGLLGAQSHPLGGSGETLLRGWYAFGDPYEVTFTDSLRMVADLADDEKIRAVLPGGIVGRAFHPHQTDQIEPYLSGEPRWWWFSDDAIEANAVATQRLLPAP